MKKDDNFALYYAISIAAQLGFFIIAPLAGFFFLGRYIDSLYQSKPLFIMIGITIGFIITVYEVWHTLKPLIKK